MTTTLTGIAVHPVKSTAIRPVAAAAIRPWGLAGDRRWMVVDGDGVMVSARTERTLFHVVADTPETDPDLASALRLRSAGRPDLTLALPEAAPVPVRLFRHHLYAVPAPEHASDWLRAVLGRDDVMLVWCDDPRRRALDPALALPGEHTAFADGYPVTVASQASVRRLDDWIAESARSFGRDRPEPLPMARFRANLVVDGEDLEPFAEDRWDRLRVGEVSFRVLKAVDRCSMTLLDPVDLSTGREPIRTLSRERRWGGETWFAMHLVPETTGTVRVGDEVVATSR